MISKTRRNWGINLLVLIAASTFILVTAELLLRWHFKANPIDTGVFYYTYDDTLGWKGWINYGRGFANNLGFRGKKSLPLNPPARKRRVLFLGDSFAEGAFAGNCDDRASDLIEKQDTGIFVYNLARSGYGTDQELLVLKRYGPSIRPHDVLLFFGLNDILYNDCDFAFGKPKPHFRIAGDSLLHLGNVPVPKRPLLYVLFKLKRRFFLVKAFFQTMNRFDFFNNWAYPQDKAEGLGLEPMPGQQTGPEGLITFSRTCNDDKLTIALLHEILEECRRLDTEFTVFLVPNDPFWTAAHEESPVAAQAALRWCSDLGIRTVNLWPVFHQYTLQTGKQLYCNDNLHWNEEGNEVAAREILRTLHEINHNQEDSYAEH